jgi:hypothetical protein
MAANIFVCLILYQYFLFSQHSNSDRGVDDFLHHFNFSHFTSKRNRNAHHESIRRKKFATITAFVEN